MAWGRCLVTMGLLGALVAAAPARAGDWIYLQRHNSVPTYSDIKPRGNFARIPRHGRPTATASCLGLTPKLMQERAERFMPVIRKAAEAHRVPAELVSAVMRVESCYDARAVSRSGARGLMQLMPATAAELGVHDSFDPEQNINGGVRYLARMLARFKNDLELALSAYNAGPEAVLAHRGVPPYPETVSYVKRILKLYRPDPARSAS